jgi:hypothetical protein
MNRRLTENFRAVNLRSRLGKAIRRGLNIRLLA